MKNKIYFPVNLDLHQKPCLVVGGGEVAFRKVQILLDFGASVTVVSPELGPGMTLVVKKGKVLYIKAMYQQRHLRGMFLVIASTDDQKVNTQVAMHAFKRDILVNVVDVPKLCNFIVPSVIRRGPIVMGISTSGQSPLFAQMMRRKCEACVTPEQGDLVQMLGDVRNKIIAAHKVMDERKAVYTRIMTSPILGLLEKGKKREARQMLKDLLK